MSWIKKQLSGLQRTTSGGRFIPFVDGMRFLAIMPVVIVHASERLMKYSPEVKATAGLEHQAEFLVSRGAIGVFIFFCLSGFILCLPFAENSRAINYKKYLSRRLTRLEPPYIFWMTLFALILVVRQELPLLSLFQHWLASLTYTHTIIYGDFSVINPVAWSLEVEIQYYLIAPFIAKLYFSYASKAHRRALLVDFILLYLVVQHIMGWHLFPVKASILGHLQHFLIGMLMADLYKNDTAWVQRKQLIWDLLAPICLLTMAYTWTEELDKTIVMNLAMALLFVSAIKGRYFPRLLSYKWLTVIGGMCYTIYLIHLPLLELYYSLIGKIGQSTSWAWQLSISLLIGLPLLLLSSMICYRMIEQPFMKKAPWTALRARFMPVFRSISFSTQKQRS